MNSGEHITGARDLAVHSGEISFDDSREAILPKRRIITVIGIDAYAHQMRLSCAVNDALGVQKLFVEKFGFEAPIAPVLDGEATKQRIESLIEDDLRSTLREDDALVLFFAGHGETRTAHVGGNDVTTGYIVPVDAGYPVKFSDLVGLENFLQKIALLPAKHILVVLDACHSGIALGSAANRFRGSDHFVHALATRTSRRVITSARNNELASDTGPIPGHSLFTGTLIAALKNDDADLDKNGIVTSSELALFLQQRVGQASRTQQTPDYGAFHLDDRGELILSIKQTSTEEPPPPPTPPPPPPPPPPRPPRLRLVIAASALVIVMALVGYGAYFYGDTVDKRTLKSGIGAAVSRYQLPSISVTIPPPPQVPRDSGALFLRERDAKADGGRAFADSVEKRSLSLVERGREIQAQIAEGNVPPHLRRLHPINFHGKDAKGKDHEAILLVAVDYLAIGSDTDFVRVSMNARTAQTIANDLGCILPTSRIVDIIYKNAEKQLVASVPMFRGSHEDSVSYGKRITSLVEVMNLDEHIKKQIGDLAPGALLAGHKKDIVVSAKMHQYPDGLFVYGWFDRDGRVFQQLNTKPMRDDEAFDISMGVRLVRNEMFVDGKRWTVTQVLDDALLAPLISAEGRFKYRSYAY